MYDVAVIGAGVTGCAIARALSRYRAKLCVLEKGEDVCTGTSKANSAIIHGGFDAESGTLKAAMNVRGNAMMTQVAEELDVPFRRNGAMVLCFDESERPGLQALYDRGVRNGVEGLRILTGEEARAMEPNLSAAVCAALYCPSSGIVCPFELTLGFAENAAENGAEFRFESGVTAIRRAGDHYCIETEKGLVEARAVVNAAGVYADAVHDMALPHAFTITPRAGEYCLCDKTAGGLVSRTIFQMPSKRGKGILVTPTVHGNLLLGPTASDLEDRAQREEYPGAADHHVVFRPARPRRPRRFYFRGERRGLLRRGRHRIARPHERAGDRRIYGGACGGKARARKEGGLQPDPPRRRPAERIDGGGARGKDPRKPAVRQHRLPL